MILKTGFRSAMAGLAALGGIHPALAAEPLTVGYFLELPMPYQYAKATGMYDEALGTEVNWVAFETGTAMSAAMASGGVQISLSQGVPPFVVAVSAGQDLKAVDITMTYSENDNCVVAETLEIDQKNARELEGRKVGVPLGTAAHFGFLAQMRHFGIDTSTLDIVDMSPPEGAAAFAQGNLDMVCGWGGALLRMKEHGNVLLSGAEKEALGILVFDVTSVPAEFAAANGELLSRFLAVTAEANAMWNAGDRRDEMLAVIAKDAGMDLDAAAATIDTFVFPPVAEQLEARWLGGGMQDYMLGVARVFEETGSIPRALDSYNAAVDTTYLQAAGEM
ncbi:ABC transporter substrate-binding protein [Tropicimonas sp.]|uniref:taurine ABC transporter substrate-binding protein n=1 Tax=Tropicimonas sp. TaxID=2067044 RepID=UPI003A856A05